MIAVAMLGWNQVEYTRSAVDAIEKNSEGHDLYWVLVNNGSHDDTRNFMNSVGGKKRVIHNPENTGVTHGWNQALASALESGADVIALVNNDTLACKGWLEPVVRELAKNDKRYFLPNGNVRIDHLEEDAARLVRDEAGKTSPGRSGWCLFFRPEAVRLFHPIPEAMRLWYGDDYIHWVLQEKHGYRCQTLHDSCVYHYVSKSFYAYKGYADQVARDKAAFEAIVGHPVS